MMDAYFSRVSAAYDRTFDRLYDQYSRAVIVPILIVLFAVAVLGMSYVNTGEVVEKGIDFTGGTSTQVQLPTNITLDEVRGAFEDDASVTVRTMTGADGDYRWVIIESQTSYTQEDIDAVFTENDISHRGDISVRRLGAAVGSAFFNQAMFWSGVAILIMSTVIFVAFRSIVPSLAVIFAALTDIMFAIAGMSLLGVELTLASLAALLMLLGYSVDTDILLSTRVLKQRDKPLKERIKSSIATGSTMTLAAVAAFVALYTMSASPLLDQLAAVIIIGLLADLPITWLGNTVILKWYVER